jgi:hypothetical protein
MFDDQASLYVLLSNIRNPMFSEHSAASGSDSMLVVVAAASLLLLYTSVYFLHHSSVGHIRRISSPPVQNMCTPSPFPLFLAFLCVCVAVPTGAICALCRRSIVWAGIRYGIKDGGVTSVVRALALLPSSPFSLCAGPQRWQNQAVRRGAPRKQATIQSYAEI